MKGWVTNKMSNADRLFYGLGYKKEISSLEDDILFCYKNKNGLIIFCEDKYVGITSNNNLKVMGITMQELKAINMKCEELNWLGDTNE